MTNKTETAIVDFLTRTAEESPDWQHFWATMMNYAKGNVSGIVKACEIANVSTTDVAHAYHELKLKARLN